MPIPEFTEQGLLPAGVHSCTLPEAQQILCSNDRRITIWDGLLGFLEWAAPLPAPDGFLIDGSYVTDKPLPGDVDVVVDITGCSEAQHQEWFAAWEHNYTFVKETFEVDFYA